MICGADDCLDPGDAGRTHRLIEVLPAPDELKFERGGTVGAGGAAS
jgi:hypothetical protein